ncbi:MAG: carboxypeptidase regulatory-like domain-containing protein [Mycobacterium sp.]
MEQFNNAITGICVAVSQTSDPTGSYYLYNFVIDATGFTDYPKMSVWPDAYYVSTNDFANVFHVNFTALDRAQMLAGQPAQQVVINSPGGNSDLAYSVLPADLDGMTPPPDGDPGIFTNFISPYLDGGSTYALGMWQMTVDWNNPANSTLAGPTEITVDPFNDGICNLSRACIPQPSPATAGDYVDSLGDRLMFRLAYRNFGDHQALVVNHTVGTGGAPSAPPAGIRWYELDAPAGATDASDWTVAQQGTYLPNDGNSRWMGSIAMDQSGNIGLGYSMSSTSLDPSAAFTGQNVGGPSGVMDAGETVSVTGSGVQEGTGNRWGDYSAMSLDPTDDCTFWTSQEYISATGSFHWSTNISSFKFDNCSAGPTGIVEGTVTAASSGSAIAGATVTLTPGNASGQTAQNGHYSITTAPGNYTATATAFGYQADSESVTITDGGTTTQDFALQSSSAATLNGIVYDTGHHYPLFAHVVIDAGSQQVADVPTGPNGKYSVSLPTGTTYTMTATPYLSGYTAGTATVTLSGDTQQNFALSPDASCSAPGYAYQFGEDFDGGTFPPTGWTVTNDVSGSLVAWQLSSAYPEDNGNYTGGSGNAADADSNVPGPGVGSYDTSLITPAISTAVVGTSPVLNFLENFNVFSGNEAFDVDISTDGGNTWTTVDHQTVTCGALYGLPGCPESMSLGSYLGGATSFELRFRYYNPVSDYDWYAQVDNIAIGTCLPIPGGLVMGKAFDANTKQVLAGVTVTDENGNTTTTGPVNGVAVGFVMFEPAGDHTLTFAKSAYQDATKDVSVSNGAVVPVWVGLNAGQLGVRPTQATLNVPVGTQQTYTLLIGNTGLAPVDWTLSSLNSPPSQPQVKQGQGVNAPLHNISGHFSPANLRTLQKEGRSASTAHAPSRGLAQPAPQDSTWAAVADYPIPVLDNCAAADQSGNVYSVTGVSNGVQTTADYVYDPTSGTWSSFADFPGGGLEKPACAMVGGKLYVTDGDNTSFTENDTLYIYDPSSDSWSTGADLPTSGAEFGAAGVGLNGKFYVIGGCDGASCTTFIPRVAEYDPGSDSWSSAADYPTGTAWEGCGAAGADMVCAGGFTPSGTDTTATYVYDPSSDSWTAGADMPYDNWGMDTIGTADGHLLVSQGVTDGTATITNLSAIYDVASDSWSSLPNNPVTTYRGAGACGFYTIGGQDGTFTGLTSVSFLSGYDVCGVGSVPWLSFNPAMGTLAGHSHTSSMVTVDGTGQTAGTSDTVQVVLGGNTPYGSITIPLTVNWTSGG